jgi:hypothetical protein
MFGLARFAFMLMVVLFCSQWWVPQARIPLPALRFARAPQWRLSFTRSPSCLLSQSPPTREFSDEKMLAWILLLMKDGRGRTVIVRVVVAVRQNFGGTPAEVNAVALSRHQFFLAQLLGLARRSSD